MLYACTYVHVVAASLLSSTHPLIVVVCCVAARCLSRSSITDRSCATYARESVSLHARVYTHAHAHTRYACLCDLHSMLPSHCLGQVPVSPVPPPVSRHRAPVRLRRMYAGKLVVQQGIFLPQLFQRFLPLLCRGRVRLQHCAQPLRLALAPSPAPLLLLP